MVSEEQNNDMELASEVVPVPQVQPEVQAPEVDGNGQVNNVSRGKPRHRKKALYAAILKQMEFYFGDSNLTKDRFLGDLVKKDPNIDIDIFLRFNKMRSLTTDKNKIVKALRDSKMLKVTEDGTKVYRTTPIVEKQNIDECTVYVQRLPADADHEWLSNLFSEYGPIAYVSIPKFKNQKIKGFAFIEFEIPEGAEKCLKAFRKKGFELPSQTSPTDVLSITTFADEEKDQNGSSDVICDNKNIKTEAVLESEKSKNKKKKRKLNAEASESDQSDVSKTKKKKHIENKDKDSSVGPSDSEVDEKRAKKRKNKVSLEEVATDNDAQKNVKESHKKKKKDKTEEEIEAENCHKNETDKTEDNEETAECPNEEETLDKKKKRKRKKKHNSGNEISGPLDKGLQVMGKKEWKKLRNKYLDLQRSRMKQLKQHMRKARWNQWGGERNKTEFEQDEMITVKKENTSSGLEFTPGVIVNIKLNEVCVDPKGFKTELRNSCSNIKYVDIKEGLNEAFIRCDSSETATALAQRTEDDKIFKVLEGEEEKRYWDKIIKDREEKIGGKVQVKQRGRNKLLKKAEKVLGIHIKFEEV